MCTLILTDEDLERYYLHRLDAAARMRVEQHLSYCNSCQESLAELEAIVELLRSEEIPVPRLPQARGSDR